MQKYTLTNPLGLTERVFAVRLLGHDANNSHTVTLGITGALHSLMGEKAGKSDAKKWASAEGLISTLSTRPEHIYLTENAATILATRERLPLCSDSVYTFLSNEGLMHQLEVINGIPSSRLDLDFVAQMHLENDRGKIPGFLSPVPVTHAVLYNLAKNAVVAQDGVNRMVRPELRIDLVDGVPAGATCVPFGAENFKQFVRFTIANDGEFPKGKQLIEYLRGPMPPSGAKGFGLHFVGIATKFMRAPINIETGNGKTRTEFYHPVYG